MLRFFVLAALALLVSVLGASLIGTASAQALVTGRPAFSEDAGTISPGRFQIEAGATVQDFRRANEVEATELSGPELLVRVGLAGGVEARVGLLDYARLRDGLAGETSGEIADPTLGVKATLPSLAGVDFAVLVETSIPLGNGFTDGGRLVPVATLIGETALAPGLGFGAQVQGAYIGERVDGVGADFGIGTAVVLGLDVTDRLGVFSELYADDLIGVGGVATTSLQLGGAFAITPNAEVDVRVGRRLTQAGPDVLARIGAAVQL